LTAPIDLNIFLRAHSRREEAQAVGRVVGQVGIGDFNLPNVKKNTIQSEVWECFDDLYDLSCRSDVKNFMDLTSYLPVDVKGGIDERSDEPGESFFCPIKAVLFGSFKSQGLKSYQIIWCVVRCLEARSSVSSSTEREAFRKHKKQD